MRAITTTERGTLAAPQLKITARVLIGDADGVYHDLTDLGAVDWLGKIRWEKNPDSPVMSGTVELRRDARVGGATGLLQSLSPLMQGSALNRRLDGTYGPVLDSKHGIVIETAETPWRVAPVDADFREVFRGLIDSVAFQATPMSIAFRDIGSRLQTTQIEVVRSYGSATGVALATVLQQILNDNGCADITLYVPDPPTILLRTQTVPLGSVMDTLNSLALQSSGSSVRYLYDAANTFRLTLALPPRNKTAVDATFGPDEYLDIPQADLKADNIRNAVKVTFTNSATGLADSVTNTDAVSIAKYGRIFMQLPEDATSAIDTTTEATALADSALSDLSSPPFEQQMRTLYFWPAEMGDLYTYLANGTHYDVDQTLASQTVTHELDGGHGYTTIGARAKPAGAYTTWLVLGDRGSEMGPIIAPQLNVVPTSTATQYSIAYTGDNVLLSIDGASVFSAPPASPVIVARSAAGGVDHTYTFRGDLNGQQVFDSVIVLAQGKDTVTPDLKLDPGTATSTTEAFTPSAVNPTGGAVPAITVTLHGTTGVNTTQANAAIAADTVTTINSGDVITVNRPFFNAASGTTLAAITVRASLPGGGAETISRTIPNQDKLKFGPNLTVSQVINVASDGSASSTITWSGEGVTVNTGAGGAYVAPPASPFQLFVIGTQPQAVTFKGLLDGQEISVALLIPAKAPVNLDDIANTAGRVAVTPTQAGAIDNTGIINATGIDFARSYVNKGLANIPDSPGRFAAIEANANNTESRTASNTANVGGMTAANAQDGSTRALGGFTASGRLQSQVRSTPLNAMNRRSVQTYTNSSSEITGADLLSSNDLAITINAHDVLAGSGTGGSGLPIHYNGGTCTGAAYGTNFVFATDSEFAGGTVTFYAIQYRAYLASFDNRYYVGQVDCVAGTISSGTPGACCDTETLILMADGTTKRAIEIVRGDMVYTCGEGSLFFGAHAVIAAEVVEVPERWLLTMMDGRARAYSTNHRFRVGAAMGVWTAVQELERGMWIEGTRPGVVRDVVPDKPGSVVRISVATAATYIGDGLLSHNMKAV